MHSWRAQDIPLNMTTNAIFCNLKGQILCIFAKNKKLIIFFCIVFLLGLAVGIAGVSALKKNFEIDDIKDILLVGSLRGKTGVFAYFLKRFFGYVFVMAIVLLLCLNFYLGLLSFLIVFYISYKIGFTIAIYCTFFGIGGIINVVLIYLPFQLLANFLLIVFVSISLGKAKFFAKCKCKRALCEYYYVFAFLALLAVVCLLEGIFVPIVLKSASFCV